MNQLVWRGETINGKYLGEVAILTDLSPVIHCETFVDGHWRLWSYIDEKEQIIQQGQASSLVEAQKICEQTALAVQGLNSPPPMQSHPMMPPMHMMQPMQYIHSFPPMPKQVAYEEIEAPMSFQELRFKFRRWAISLTMIGGVFLCIWYSMLLKPVSTISLLLVLTSIVWGAQALIKSFKRPKASVANTIPSVDDGITLFSKPHVLPQFSSAAQLGFPANHLQTTSRQTAQPFVQIMPQAIPQFGAQLPTQLANQQTNQTGFYTSAQPMQFYPRGNG